MIGSPAVRYREDPVRIIRAVRFAAKLSALGFKFEDKTVAPLREMKGLLADVPQSRLFDEMLKLLQTGHALASIAQLKFLGLGTGIYPLLDVVVENADEPFLKLALQDTDRRVGEGKPVAPSFLLSCVLWADVREGWEQRKKRGEHLMPALQDAIDDAFNAKIGDVSGRGKLGTDMREIWTMQPRFEKRTGSAPYSLLDQPRFRAGFDFLRLRAQTGRDRPGTRRVVGEIQHRLRRRTPRDDRRGAPGAACTNRRRRGSASSAPMPKPDQVRQIAPNAARPMRMRPASRAMPPPPKNAAAAASLANRGAAGGDAAAAPAPAGNDGE